MIEAVKAGRIKRFFVIAGCDAPGKGGEYYRELATSLPPEVLQDTFNLKLIGTAQEDMKEMLAL